MSVGLNLGGSSSAPLVGVNLGTSSTLSLPLNLGGSSTSATSSPTPLLGNGNYLAAPPDLGLALPVGAASYVENVLPPLLNSSLLGQVFYSLRSAWSSDLVPIPVTGTGAVPNFDFSNVANVLRVGETFSLFTSLPKPGTVVTLPVTNGGSNNAAGGVSSSAASSPISGSATASGSTASSSASASATNAGQTVVNNVKNILFTIPEGAAVAGKWEFFKKDANDTAFVPAIKATSSRDSAGHYQLLNGTLLSTISGSSQYVFWPSPSQDGSKRQVAACLRATLFVPDGNNQTLTAPRICFGTLVDSWSSVLGDISSGTIKQDPKNTAFPPNMKDLFRINIDTTAPLPGVPVTLSVLPIDKTTLLAPRIDSILDNSPDVHLQAGLDVGAPLQAFINQATKAVTGLFSPISGASGATNKFAGGALSVSKVLTGLLTIPIALDIQGRQLTKTLKPLAGEDLLSNVVALPGTSGLAGSLPIGALTATIKSVADNITAITQPANTIVQKAALENLHGLTMNFLPRFIGAGQDVGPNKVTIQLGLNTQVLLPGFDVPLIHSIDLGSITITLPSITLPQIAFFFHGYGYTTSNGDDILVAIDPVTFRLASSVNQLTSLLSDLTHLLSTIRQIFPTSLINSFDSQLGPSIDNFLTVAGSMLNLAVKAPATGNGYLRIYDFSKPGAETFNSTAESGWGAAADTQGHPEGVSSILWIGIAAVPGYRLWMNLIRSTTSALYFVGSGAWQFSGYIADQAHQSESLRTSGAPQMVKSARDFVGVGQPYNSASSPSSNDFNDNVDYIYYQYLTGRV